MKTFLDKMKDLKAEECARRGLQISEEELREKISGLPTPNLLSAALIHNSGNSPAIIAEVKARAPGRENVSELKLESVIRDYESGGAAAISVLTDEQYFGGSLESLATASTLTGLPLLHKEFIFSPYQLLEGRIRGASAALILAYYFTEEELRSILEEARNIGLECVVEVSLESEVPRVLAVNPDLLMVNNRAIAALPENPTKTYMQGSPQVTVDYWNHHADLRKWKQQPGKLLISASSVSTPADTAVLASVPCDAVLVGNAAMTATDRVSFLHSLNTPVQSHAA